MDYQRDGVNVSAIQQALLGYGSAAAPLGDFLDGMRGGVQSAELFTRPNGVNEFELVYSGGLYYFFCHDYGTGNIIKVRTAATVAGLAGASEISTGVLGAYPSVFFDGTTWHMFVRDISSGEFTYRYTASSGTSTSWTNVQTVVSGTGYDFQVRQNPADNTFWAGYKEPTGNKRAGIMTSPSITGPWTDRGFIFSTIGTAPWHSVEEADGMPMFTNGKLYYGFAAWDGIRQRVSMVEIDTTTYKAIGRPVAIVEPLLPWQQRNSSQKVFNPIVVPNEPVANRRIYFAQNPSATGITTGWAYIEEGPAPSDGRTVDHLVLANYLNVQQDKATGIITNVWGVASYSGTPPNAYLDTTAAGTNDGGAYGWLNQTNIPGDFTIKIDFEINTVLGSGAFMRLFRVGQLVANANPIAAMWAQGQGGSQFRLYYEVRNADNSVNSTGFGTTTTLAANTRYRGTLQRSGNTITMYLDGGPQATGSFTSVLTGANQWAITNKDSFNGDTDDNQDMIGKVYSFQVVNSVVAP